PVSITSTTIIATLLTAGLLATSVASAQGPFGQAGPQPPAPLPGLPNSPTAVALPSMSSEVTGPGPIFDSAPSQAPGHGLADYDYVTNEYFVSGTADGKPYTTRLVVRRPAESRDFSGLVLAESMHTSGAAH